MALLKVLVASGVPADGEGFAPRLVALWAWLLPGQVAADRHQVLLWAAALQSQCCSFPLSSIPVSCCFSLALMWIQSDSVVPFVSPGCSALAPSFSSLPAHPSYHVSQSSSNLCYHLLYIPSSAAHILPESWSQLLLKYFPSTVYVWRKKNLMMKGFNDDVYLFIYKDKFMSEFPFKVPE